jgi:hypothetical protein
MAPMTLLNKLSYDNTKLHIAAGEPWALKTVDAKWDELQNVHTGMDSDSKGKQFAYLGVQRNGEPETRIPIQVFLSLEMANEVVTRYKRGGQSASAAPQGDDTATMLAKAIKSGGIASPDAQRFARAAFNDFGRMSPNVDKLKAKLAELGVRDVFVTLKNADWTGADVELADTHDYRYIYHAKGPRG